MPYQIEPCTPGVQAQAVAFAWAAWQQLFAQRPGSASQPADLVQFSTCYAGAGGRFLLARDGAGALVGCIGYRPYDGRFTALALPVAGTVEVARLFVAPEHRRAGLGTALVRALMEAARTAEVQRLYLHTHPFLPGAVAFWQRQGFAVLQQEADPVWRTVHMVGNRPTTLGR